jgi:hypothetical protein
MRTVRKLVSLLGLIIIVFAVFLYMPQYEYWLALLATAALFVAFRPWQTLPSKCDRVFMGAGSGGWVRVKKDSWRPVWTCESCGKLAIDQTESGQMLPCRACRHENESFGPHLWCGELADMKDTGVVVNDEVMRVRQAPADRKIASKPKRSD